MSTSSSSDSEYSSSHTHSSNPKPISPAVMNLLNEHKAIIPGVVYRQTARMSAMSPYEATKGRQLAPRSQNRKASVPLTPASKPMKRTLSSSRRRKAIPRWTSSEESSDAESADTSEDGYLGHDTVDESDEEERGDEDRRSLDDADNDSIGDSGSDANDYFANDDGDDSNF